MDKVRITIIFTKELHEKLREHTYKTRESIQKTVVRYVTEGIAKEST